MIMNFRTSVKLRFFLELAMPLKIDGQNVYKNSHCEVGLTSFDVSPLKDRIPLTRKLCYPNRRERSRLADRPVTVTIDIDNVYRPTNQRAVFLRLCEMANY